MRAARPLAVLCSILPAAPAMAELKVHVNRVALEEVARAGRYLGIGLANLIHLCVAELIVLSGNVMNSPELFLPAIREVISRQCRLVPADRVELILSTLRGDAPLIGAAVLWTQRYAGERA